MRHRSEDLINELIDYSVFWNIFLKLLVVLWVFLVSYFMISMNHLIFSLHEVLASLQMANYFLCSIQKYLPSFPGLGAWVIFSDLLN